jgi:hypothetical protein
MKNILSVLGVKVGIMKRELKYFSIEGNYGGNQDWFKNIVMRMGGCAAITACDSCIYLARHFQMNKLYPYDISNITREDYTKFGVSMKPYLKPRMGGVDKLSLFTAGFGKYTNDVGSNITLEEISGENSFEKAKEFVITQIDKEIPIPYLLLKHSNHTFKDFGWHWFLVTGYEIRDEKFYIKVATYGEKHTLNFNKLWHTGYDKKGGMIDIKI